MERGRHAVVVGACAAFALGACGGQSRLEQGGAASGGREGGVGGGAPSSGGTGGAAGTLGSATGASGEAGAMCTLTSEDRDGDGINAIYGTACPSMVVMNDGGDCDDGDAELQTWVYADHDGDGVGTAAEKTCAPAGQIPDGHSALSTDCDDDDPRRSPLQLDIPGDGIDQDCDLVDAPVCASGDLTCPCAQLIAAVPSIDPSCPSYDLVLLDAVSCRLACHVEFYARIANLGTTDFDGVITVTEGDAVETLMGPIPAGAVTEPRRFGGGFYLGAPITLATDGSDCHPENDTFSGMNPPPLEPLCVPK